MPMDSKRYPPNWKEISLRIRDREGWRCKWCGAPNGQPHPRTGSKVVLTVAHLGAAKPDGTPGDKHDKMDVRDENLAALCQACHLKFDIREHVENRRRNREAKALRSGQLPMWQGRAEQ